jgi:hypothetical protein
MADGVHVPDDEELHAALHERARTILEFAVRRCVHSRIPSEIIMRELTDLLAAASVENQTPLSEVVAELIDSYESTMLAPIVIFTPVTEPKASNAN